MWAKKDARVAGARLREAAERQEVVASRARAEVAKALVEETAKEAAETAGVEVAMGVASALTALCSSHRQGLCTGMGRQTSATSR
jgi:hypothetical protein